MKPMMPVAALAACAVMAACSPKPAEPAPAPVAPVAQAAACDTFKAADNGIVQTFCTGKAVVKFTVDGKEHTLSGGTCNASTGAYTLNAGVVTNDQAADPLPDYVGLTNFEGGGAFTDATLAIVIEGKRLNIRPNKGELGPKGGTFEGEARFSHKKIVGSFTC